MDQWRVITLTITKEWKIAGGLLPYFFKLVTDASRAAALAWIIYQSGNLDSLGFLTIGVALLAIWAGGSAFGGWALEQELSGRTLDHALISRTSMPLILFSKVLGEIVREIPSAIIAGAVVLLVARHIPSFANPGALIFSLFLAIIQITIVCTTLAAITTLVAADAGAMIGIIPFGAVLSGLILPAANMPLALEIPARCVPSTWAMEGVWLSVGGTGSWGSILLAWAVSIILSAFWLIATKYLCKVAERKIRIKGTLGAY
jgi:ABC-type multidrug transport system permease subunit